MDWQRLIAMVSALGFSVFITNFVFAAPPTTQPQTEPSVDLSQPGVVSLGDGITIEFVGIARCTGTSEKWYDIDGSPIDAPALPESLHVSMLPIQEYEAMIRVTCPQGDVVQPSIEGMTASDSGMDTTAPGEQTYCAVFDVGLDKKTVDMIVNIADEPWSNGYPIEPLTWIHSFRPEPGLMVAMTPLNDRDNKALAYLTISGEGSPWRMICFDRNGNVHDGNISSDGGAGMTPWWMCGISFDIPAKSIVSLQWQTRPFTKTVTAKNVPLDEDHPTTPEIVVSAPPTNSSTQP